MEKSILLITVSLRTALKLLGKLQRTRKGFLMYLLVGSTFYFLEGHMFLFHWGKKSYTKGAKSTEIKTNSNTLSWYGELLYDC